MTPANAVLAKGRTAAAICVVTCSVACSSGDDFGVVGDDDAGANPADPGSWELVAVLDTSPAQGLIRYAAIVDGWLYSVEGDGIQSGLPGFHRWSVEDGRHEILPWQGTPGGWFESSVTCVVDHRMFLLGGGGNGVTLPNGDFHWEGADLLAGAWLPGGEHARPVHSPAIASDAGRCFLAGGWWGGLEPYNDPVQEFVADTGEWLSYPPLPVETSHGYAALMDGLLFFAGGGRDVLDGEEAYTYWGVAEDRTFVLEIDDPDADWVEGTPLPAGLLGGRAMAIDGRLYLFGGVTNDEEDQHLWLSTFWSWGPGEASWRREGTLPSGIDVDRPAVLQAHGEYVYAVVSMYDDAGAPALLRWRPPGG